MMSNALPNRMYKGCIVKIKTTILFDECTARRNKAPWIYGVIDFLDDVCKETKERAWSVKWAGNHMFMRLESFTHLCAIAESDLTLVRSPGEGDCALGKYYKTSHFFKKGEQGEWSLKNYENMCEYCGGTECDRMVFWEDLDFDYEEMYHDNDKENNEKRKFMYKSHIFTKHGGLGAGRRKKLQDCVYEYVTDMFPAPEGMSLMGHRES